VTEDLAIAAEVSTRNPEPRENSQVQPPDTDAELGKKALAGSIWMIAATGGAKVLGFGCQLALAWFLTREEFGVFAIAVSVSVILSALRDGGLQMYWLTRAASSMHSRDPCFG